MLRSQRLWHWLLIIAMACAEEVHVNHRTELPEEYTIYGVDVSHQPLRYLPRKL